MAKRRRSFDARLKSLTLWCEKEGLTELVRYSFFGAFDKRIRDQSVRVRIRQRMTKYRECDERDEWWIKLLESITKHVDSYEA